jgi:hypothetical protein
VQELIEVVPQLGPSNASMNVLLAVRLLPPAAISAMSIFTDVQPLGVVNVYHTSYFVPAHDPAMPELVALYRVPDEFTQLVPGVRDVGVEQSSDCAHKNCETEIEINNRKAVRAVACCMVLKRIWIVKNVLKADKNK